MYPLPRTTGKLTYGPLLVSFPKTPTPGVPANKGSNGFPGKLFKYEYSFPLSNNVVLTISPFWLKVTNDGAILMINSSTTNAHFLLEIKEKAFLTFISECFGNKQTMNIPGMKRRLKIINV